MTKKSPKKTKQYEEEKERATNNNRLPRSILRALTEEEIGLILILKESGGALNMNNDISDDRTHWQIIGRPLDKTNYTKRIEKLIYYGLACIHTDLSLEINLRTYTAKLSKTGEEVLSELKRR